MSQPSSAAGANISAITAAIAKSRAPRRLPVSEIVAVAELGTQIACDLLERRHNRLSPKHREAIRTLMHGLAELAAGTRQGRFAYALPTGYGKTTAAASFIAALHRSGHSQVAVVVAISQVHALGKFRDELIGLGIPDQLIGLKHTVRDSEVRSTGDDSRLYQLVTHVRMRASARRLPSAGSLASEYEGHERALCIFDETLWRADTASMRADAVRGALAFMRDYNPSHPLASYLTGLGELLARRSLQAQEGAQRAMLDMPPARADELEEWVAMIERDPVLRENPAMSDQLVSLLKFADEHARLQVVTTGQGNGLISVRPANLGLENVAILDASTPIRELVKLDPTIEAVQLPTPLKTYEHVQVLQRLTAGGRSSLEKRTAQLAKEVADIVQSELAADPERCFLIFTFKDRGSDRPTQRIQTELARIGIDVEEVNADGKPKYSFLTWGQQEGLNGYEHANSVILAGVLTRDHISVSAVIRGQTADPSTATPDKLVSRMIESEIGHCVYQAASRGSCRLVDNGKARAMRLHILHKNQSLRGQLEPVMPGAVWDYPAPKFLPPSRRTGQDNEMLRRVRMALKGLPATYSRISSRELKDRMGMDPNDNATRKQFTVALRQLTGPSDGWESTGRSVRRAK